MSADVLFFAGDESVLVELENALLNDVDDQVRQMAAWATGWIGKEVSLPVLEKALNDPAQKVRDTARSGIGELAEPIRVGEPPREPAMGILRRVAKESGYEDVRSGAESSMAAAIRRSKESPQE